MKAVITIKRRKEPLEISEERGRKLAELKASPETDPSTILDLNEWVGEIRDIKSIDFVKEEKPRANIVEEYAEEEERLKKQTLPMPLEERAKQLGIFKTSYFMRSGMTKQPDEATMKKAEKLALAYLKENPETIKMPMDVFKEIFWKDFGTALKVEEPDSNNPADEIHR